jgi:tetratricopeptide (TPR) repeat protein
MSNRKLMGLKKEIEEFELRLGSKHKVVAERSIRLARLYKAEKQFEQAEFFFLKALVIDKNIYGEDSIHISGVLCEVGDVFFELNKNKEALEYYTQALFIVEKEYGGKHKLVADVLLKMANIYFEIDSLKKAEEFYERCLPLQKEQMGGKCQKIFDIQKRLGFLYFVNGHNYGNAFSLLTEVLKEKLRFCEEDDSEVFILKRDLALISLKLEKESILKKANILLNEAKCSYDGGLFIEAEERCLKALAIYKKEFSFGKGRLRALQDLSSIYIEQKKYEKAQIFLEEALLFLNELEKADKKNYEITKNDIKDIEKRIFETKIHIRMIPVFKMLQQAEELFESHALGRAQKLYERALIFYKKEKNCKQDGLNLIKDRLKWIESAFCQLENRSILEEIDRKNNVAISRFSQGHYKSAESLFKDVLGQYEKFRTPELYFAKTLYFFAENYFKQEEIAEAHKLLDRLKRVYQYVYCSSHPKVKKVCNFLIQIKKKSRVVSKREVISLSSDKDDFFVSCSKCKKIKKKSRKKK